ncbi:unnamed protein product [Effrenium voratum]|nr:unnamed protein product [Effrenium voratum]
MPWPWNLAKGAVGRRSWAADFALALRCRDPSCALANPHTWQRVALPTDADVPELDALPSPPRVLTGACPRAEYRQRKEEAKSTVHWGQRKLFMAELEFLLDFAAEAQLLVYAGAAEGHHLAFLCELFPEIQVEAWDPRPFARSAVPPQAPRNLRVHQEYFTEEVAKALAERQVPLLFVSDIRTADWQRDSAEEHDARLLADLRAQETWVDILRPKRALLKFRFPYSPGCTETLDGELRLPVWGPQSTTECRLLVTPQDGAALATKRWDHQCLWEQLFYFNTVTRISIYPRPAFAQDAESEATLRTAGLCRCYDCTREVELLAEYLQRRRKAKLSGSRALWL